MDVVIAVIASVLVVLALVAMLAKYVMGEQSKMAQNYEYMLRELESRAAQMGRKERELQQLRKPCPAISLCAVLQCWGQVPGEAARRGFLRCRTDCRFTRESFAV